jgi:hypothetical protein
VTNGNAANGKPISFLLPQAVNGPSATNGAAPASEAAAYVERVIAL